MTFAGEDEDQVTYFVLELVREPAAGAGIVQAGCDVDLQLGDAAEKVDRVPAYPRFVHQDVVLTRCLPLPGSAVLERFVCHVFPFWK